jgi:oligoribonuclease
MTELLVWVDLETTGLDVRTDVILEVGIIVTTPKLEILDEFMQVVHQHDKVLDSMNEWCINQHGASGLTRDSRESTYSLQVVEQNALDFIERYAPTQGTAVMCGNTISFDRQFLQFHMRALHDWFHYRNIDVSGIKTLGKLWYPELEQLNKKGNHRTLGDLHDSIEELKYYQERIFK